MDSSDVELLAQYARNGSEVAFTELTRRYLTLVYSAALRQVAGDLQTAEDVVQMVFIELARHARQLVNHTALNGWLYTTTRQVAGHVRRSRQRRERREQEAHAMHNQNHASEPDDWRELRQVLDESMHELPEPDRLALLVRFFEGRELRRVGEVLGLNENAARLRVQRALEKLRGVLTRKGVTTTAAGLAALLTAHTVTAAPAALLASTAASVLCAGGVAKLGGMAATKTILLLMKTPLAYTSALLLASVPLVIQQIQIQNARAELTSLRNDLASLNVPRATPSSGSPAEELASLRRDEAELLGLRREIQGLQGTANDARKADWAKAEAALRSAEAERDTEAAETEAIELHLRTVNSMKHLGLAARIFCNDHADQLPRTFEEMKVALEGAAGADNMLDRFEFYPQPRAISETEPQLFLFREKEPRRTSDGKWQRCYTLVDGSVQTAGSDTADFAAWEQKAHGIASPENPDASGGTADTPVPGK